MNTAHRCFTILIVIVAGTLIARTTQLDGGQDQSPQSPTKSSRPTAQPAYRPKLGPLLGSQNQAKSGAPESLAGPHQADINDPARLLAVHSIFVERMDNGLAENLVQRIGSGKRFSIALDPDHADAVLHGTCFDSAHLKTLHSEVFLSTPTGLAIWQDVVRQPYQPSALSQAVAATADSINTDLIASLHVARMQ